MIVTMRSLLLIIVCILCCQTLLAQEERKEFDFIISIDGELPKSLYNPQVLMENDDNRKVMNVNYYPGRLSFSHNDYDSLLSSQKGVKLILKFDYYEYVAKGQRKIHNYEIEMGRNWFDQSYIILKVYNSAKKRGGKKLHPLSGKDYTFDLEYPGGAMLHVQE